MKNRLRELLDEYMSFKFLLGFMVYPIFLAILPFEGILTPLFSITFALIALIPLYGTINQLFIKKDITYKELFQGAFLEKFLYYHLVLTITFIVKGFIYKYIGIMYIIIGIILALITIFIFVTRALVQYSKKILHFIVYISPIPLGIIIASIMYQLGYKESSISTIVFYLLFGVILILGFIRIIKSFIYKGEYQDKLNAKIYLAFLPVAFISMSLLMQPSLVVTNYYYFMAMFLVSILTYLLIIVLAIVTLNNKNKSYIRRNWTLYLFLIPAAMFALVFAYIPMIGILLAFKDYNIHAAAIYGGGPLQSFFLSPWVGFEHFQNLFLAGDFVRALKNTLIISTFKIVFVFPLPIFLAIMINEVKNKFYKSTVQTLVYLPHFISWAIVGGIFYGLLAAHGPINTFLVNLRLMDDAARVVWYNDPELFQGVLVVSYAWKEVGYSAIVYLAAIVGINPALYEAAKMDGANKFKQILYVTLPGLAPTIAMLFVLRLGYLLEAGFDQVIVMANENVRSTSEIIGTYVYRIGLGANQFSFATAVGLFNSVVALFMILLGNFITSKFFNKGLW